MRWIGPVRCREYCEPVSQVRSADSMGYAVERGSKPLQFYTLPVRGIQELHADDSFSAGEGGLLFEHALAIDEMAEGVQNFLGMLDVETAGRFVEYEELGFCEECERESESLANSV